MGLLTAIFPLAVHDLPNAKFRRFSRVPWVRRGLAADVSRLPDLELPGPSFRLTTPRPGLPSCPPFALGESIILFWVYGKLQGLEARSSAVTLRHVMKVPRT